MREMRKRYLVLGLSVFLALALAVPALGGPSNPVASTSASALKIAKKALRKANHAQSTANTALSNAAAAQSTANSAQSDANAAQTSANAAQTTANQAKTAAQNAQTAADAANANANTRLKGIDEVAGSATANDTNSPKSGFADCPSGTQVSGGGYSVGGTNPNQVTVTAQHVQLYGGGWFASGRAISGFTPTWSIVAFAECASP